MADPEQDSFTPINVNIRPKEGEDSFVPITKENLKNFNKPQSFTKDDIIDFARPAIADALVTGGTALGGPIGGGLGLLAGVGIDKLLQHSENQPPQGIISQSLGLQPGGMASDAANTGEMLLGNYLFGKATKALYNGFNASRITNSDLQKLGATVSQYQDPGKLKDFSKFMEDTFARGTKSKAQQSAAQIGYDMGNQMSAKLAGRSPSTVADTQVHAKLIQQEAIKNAQDLMDGINHHETEAAFYKPVYQNVQTGVDPITQQPIFTKQQINPNADYAKYKTAKDFAGQTRLLYGQLIGEDGLKQLVKDPNNIAISRVDDILKDYEKVQRALKSSSLKIPGLPDITSPQLKDDLQGYAMMRIMNGTAKDEATTGAVRSINPQAVIDRWQDPEMQASYRTLFTADQRAGIDQFLKNLSRTQEKMGNGFSTNAKIIWGVDGLYALGNTILGGGINWGMIPAAVRLSGGALGKLMATKGVARYLVAASSGQPITGLRNQAIVKGIADALNGTIVDVIDRSGKRTRGEIEDGQFHPLSPASN